VIRQRTDAAVSHKLEFGFDTLLKCEVITLHVGSAWACHHAHQEGAVRLSFLTNVATVAWLARGLRSVLSLSLDLPGK